MHLNDSAYKAISKNFTSQISLYAVAATAAGVGVLALAQPAQAEVVVTKTNIPVTYLSSALLDLNHDGINDFKLSIHLYLDVSASTLVNAEALAGGNVVDSGGFRGPYASDLMRGAKIGPSDHFSSRFNIVDGVTLEQVRASSRGAVHTYGKWRPGMQNRYLGVKFLIKGATHYGWIRVNLTAHATSPISATITAYGYETVANKTITAGAGLKATGNEVDARGTWQPRAVASLGMLALGAEGMRLWRREEDPACP